MTAPAPPRAEVEVEAPAWSKRVADVEAVTERAALAVLRGFKSRPGAVAVILLTDDATIHDLNSRFRGKDAPTNVLAFPASANPEGHLGDIALGFEVCEREAREQAKSLADHLSHLVVHGVLHLLGYDHQDDAQAEAMESIERTILQGLGVPDPYREAAGTSPSHG